jgi:GT2 family glycosyltransferase
MPTSLQGPSASVVVPIHNGSRHLSLFWNSLLEALGPRTEVILIDDGSTEDVTAHLPSSPAHGEIVRLRNERSQGYASAVNAGLAASRGDIIFLLNTDVILSRSCIEALHDELVNHDDAGIVGAKLLYPQTGRVQHYGVAFTSVRKLHVFTNASADSPMVLRKRDVQATTFAVVALKRSVLERIGLLDARYRNGSEDIDYCMRARQAGFTIRVTHEAVAYHWESASGVIRHAATNINEARFWSQWGTTIVSDLGDYLVESLRAYPEPPVEGYTLVDLTRGEESIDSTTDAMNRAGFPAPSDLWHFRQCSSPNFHIWLPMLLPPDASRHHRPFVFLTTEISQLTQNDYWWAARTPGFHDLIIDQYANVVPTSALRSSAPTRLKGALDAS